MQINCLKFKLKKDYQTFCFIINYFSKFWLLTVRQSYLKKPRHFNEGVHYQGIIRGLPSSSNFLAQTLSSPPPRLESRRSRWAKLPRKSADSVATQSYFDWLLCICFSYCSFQWFKQYPLWYQYNVTCFNHRQRYTRDLRAHNGVSWNRRRAHYYIFANCHPKLASYRSILS